MAKVMSGRAPKYIEDLFRTKEQITSLVLRDSSNKLEVPFLKTDCFKQSISYSGATLWKGLPRSKRNAATCIFHKVMVLRPTWCTPCLIIFIFPQNIFNRFVCLLPYLIVDVRL